MIIQGTTPNLRLRFKKERLDLSQLVLTQIWATITSNDKSFNKTWDINEVDVDTTNNEIVLHLTQEDTLAMPIGDMKVQIRLLNADDSANATFKRTFRVGGVLKEGVIR